jgi:ATPase family protein associated with various cellular activities (AAA)
MPVGVSEVAAPSSPVLDDDQREAVELLRSALDSPEEIVVVIHGARGSGRRSALAQATSRSVLALDVRQIDASITALDHALVGLFREASLRGAIAVIVDADQLATEGDRDARARVIAQRVDEADVAVALVAEREGFEPGSTRPAVRIAWPVPDVAARRALWRNISGGDHPDLAERYRIGAGAITKAMRSARAIARKAPSDALTSDELACGLRHNTAERMAGLAEHVVVRQGWDDCVLPEDVETQVVALIGRAQQAHRVFEEWGYRARMPRGTGVAAMFSGPPGTGKTLVAGLIANELGLELYQVDLSKIVSKWIGETEKQLSQVFDAAEDGHAVLLFDEADSLFGQRSSEIRGATDRYANLEVNFLLQRIENFHGIVILTTNLDGSIDKAFKRRLAAHVVFQHPDEHDRALLWQRMVTADGAPLDHDIDARVLARRFPKMTGANIRNAALAAAFVAAARSKQLIDQATLIAAARSEYLSMGHVLAADSL